MLCEEFHGIITVIKHKQTPKNVNLFPFVDQMLTISPGIPEILFAYDPEKLGKSKKQRKISKILNIKFFRTFAKYITGYDGLEFECLKNNGFD